MERRAEEAAVIHEIFVSTQGEAPYAFIPTAFIRLFGCNRTCSWCDTGYTEPGRSPEGRRLGKMTPAEALDKALGLGFVSMIDITGGEPLLRPKFVKGVYDLVQRRGLNIRVCIETNGELFGDYVNGDTYSDIPDDLILNLSPKLPGSGTVSPNIKDTVKEVSSMYDTFYTNLKLVIANQKDYDFVADLLEEVGFQADLAIQPAYGVLSYKELWAMYQKRPLRSRTTYVGIQAHKALEMP